ncbi:MAG: TraR/DksA C4-type zinc finger protein [Candidatus Kaiserbacteria bacterium]|nr:TraR/DksA C4-type zinc finger protein [Candidatus Kaiserbacteria bacterium]MCB9816524.1 TraR/DksA C4-type zinc finger protein [Candidatus Nomurabacteria bacterium]
MSHEALKTRLETELDQVITELNTIAAQNPDTGDWVARIDPVEIGNADENVVADTTEDWDTNRALLTQLETRYRNITRALEKFATDTYGICEISGEPIEEARLNANPAARTNIANIDRESELPI